MMKKFAAVYEDGVLRPLEPLDLREHQRVTVIVSLASEETWLDVDCVQLCASQADDSISLEAVRATLSRIPGSLTADFRAERDES